MAAIPEGVVLLDRQQEEDGWVASRDVWLRESIADLERRMLDPGWRRMVATSEEEFSAEGLRQIRAVCRLYAVKHPLILRGLGLRAAYVWGRGVEITARATGKAGQQDVQKVITRFWDDPGNQQAVTGHTALNNLEWKLGTEGEVYIVCFTSSKTGAVRSRTIPADEVTEVITDPDDAAAPWYYRREWVQKDIDTSGRVSTRQVAAFYPHIDYQPTKAKRYPYIDGVPVQWDAPVIRVAVNQYKSRGVPDAYAAVDWAKAYKEFLEDWARLMRALSRYAYKATAPGGKTGPLRARLAQPPSRDAAGEPNAAGSTIVVPPDVALEAVSKSGATIDSESGRPLAMMVASALHLPVTMLLEDPGQTGARATAQTLDQPTELPMDNRRRMWEQVLRRLLRHVITSAVKAEQGLLKGHVEEDPMYGTETLVLDGDTPADVDFAWPSLDDINPTTVIESVVRAQGSGTIPPETVARLLLTALGVRNVESILERLVDDDGNFLWPETGPQSMGADAAAAARAGEDPAGSGPGSMVPAEDPPDDEDDDSIPEPAR